MRHGKIDSEAEQLSARVAALEAEREKLRAVVLAVADHMVMLDESRDDADEVLGDALEAALVLPLRAEWVAIAAALRALAGAP